MKEVEKMKATISIDGYKGRWTFVGHRCINGRWLHLLENDEYGEDCGHLILNDRGEVVADGVYNGFDD